MNQVKKIIHTALHCLLSYPTWKPTQAFTNPPILAGRGPTRSRRKGSPGPMESPVGGTAAGSLGLCWASQAWPRTPPRPTAGLGAAQCLPIAAVSAGSPGAEIYSVSVSAGLALTATTCGNMLPGPGSRRGAAGSLPRELLGCEGAMPHSPRLRVCGAGHRGHARRTIRRGGRSGALPPGSGHLGVMCGASPLALPV